MSYGVEATVKFIQKYAEDILMRKGSLPKEPWKIEQCEQDVRTFDYQLIAMHSKDNFISSIYSWRELLGQQTDLMHKPIADPNLDLNHQGLAEPAPIFGDIFERSSFPSDHVEATPAPRSNPPVPPRKRSGGRMLNKQLADKDETPRDSGMAKKKRISEKERLKRKLLDLGQPEERVEGLSVRALRAACAKELHREDPALSGFEGRGERGVDQAGVSYPGSNVSPEDGSGTRNGGTNKSVRNFFL